MRTLAIALIAIATLSGFAEAQPRPSDRDAFDLSRGRGWIGLSFRGDTSDPSSLLVTGVVEDAPAESAGIRSGDRLVRWNGESDVARAVSTERLRAGDTIVVRLRRSGERDRDVTIVAESRPVAAFWRDFDVDPEAFLEGHRDAMIRIDVLRDSLLVHADQMRSHLEVLLRDSLGPRIELLARDARLRAVAIDSAVAAANDLSVQLTVGRNRVAGAELTDVGAGLADYFGVTEGALVLRVGANTPASRAGLREGDVIVRAGGEAVSDVSDLRRAVAAADDGNLEMEVVRRGNRHLLLVPR